MPHPVIEAAERNKRELLRGENQASTRLINAYGLVYGRLSNKVEQLQREIELLDNQGNLTINRVRKLAVYGSLLNQITDEVSRYGGFVDTELKLADQNTIKLALDHSQRITQSYFLFNKTATEAFNMTWDRLPTESIETLLGFLREDSPLHTNLTRDLGTTAATVFEQNLIEGIALGYNSAKVAKAIDSSLGQPLSWTLNSVRTANLWTYREASRANYLNNSEIVEGWKWYAALDSRTCMSCFSQHGKEFTLEQSLNDHHQGRCTQIPIVSPKYGITQPEIPLGEDVFNSMPRDRQISQMGLGKFNAYRDGEFKFSELSEVYQNTIYGDMLKEKSLKSLLAKPKPIAIPIKPLGVTDISNKLDFEKSKSLFSDKINDYGDSFKDEIIHLQSKHKIPDNLPNIPVNFRGKGDRNGAYRYDDNGKALGISLYNGDHTELTLMHEIGHYLDQQGFVAGKWASENSKELQDWKKAVDSTTAINHLKEMSNDSLKRKITTSYGFGEISKDQVDYYLDYKEIFARSYAQYISIGNPKLTNQVNNILSDKYFGNTQWKQEDFKPVEKAFIELFKKLKWS